MTIEDYSSRIALDARALDDLRAKAKTDPRAALKGAVQQFEAYFMQSMLKSMRDTLSQDSMFDSDQTRFYTSMFDQQLGQNLAGSGSMGLARVLEAQLSRGLPESSAVDSLLKGTSLPVGDMFSSSRLLPPAVERALREAQDKIAAGAADRGSSRWPSRDSQAVQKNPGNATLPLTDAVASGVANPGVPVAGAGAPASPREFVAQVWPHAVAAAEVTGLPPYLTVAHAALESGWGRSEPLRSDGSPSYNLFGIKAGKSWAGDTVAATTTEYEAGKAQTRIETFRAYGSYREAFLDYAQLLAASPRFSPVLASTGGTDFANSLQQSGYATDPMYAAKLTRIIQGKTLRDALQG